MEKINFTIAKFVSNVWPLGLFPFAQGTLCSFFAAIIGFLINSLFGSEITLLLAILSGIAGWFSTNMYIKKSNNEDPSEVVIDEFSGQLIASSAAGTSLLFNILGFILFRILDVLKPGIIKKVENLRGATGVMMDDWVAGSFVALFLITLSIFGLIDYNWYMA